MFSSPLLGTENFQQVIVDSAVSNFNLFTELNSPAYPVAVLLNIKDTAVVTGLNFGGLNPASVIRVLNQGHILGAGGAGGNGGFWDPESGSYLAPPRNGSDGSAALIATCKIELLTSSGRIWGGGGGGGAGNVLSGNRTEGGGGGVSGGAGGSGSPAGTAATSGINATPGGANGTAGAGGSWGAAGSPGAGTAGGQGGKAIELNGNEILYLESDLTSLTNEGRIIGLVS